MGVVGLAGVVVNDSIVLVEFIKKGRSQGLSPFDASVQAGAKRLRAVYLTTITTFFGLIPTAYGIGGFDPFLQPMALSMSWGLIFGTFITLFATPILYNILSDLRKLVMRSLKPADSFMPVPAKAEDEIEERLHKRMQQNMKDCMEQEIIDCVENELEKRLYKKLEKRILNRSDKKGSNKKKPKRS